MYDITKISELHRMRADNWERIKNYTIEEMLEESHREAAIGFAELAKLKAKRLANV